MAEIFLTEFYSPGQIPIFLRVLRFLLNFSFRFSLFVVLNWVPILIYLGLTKQMAEMYITYIVVKTLFLSGRQPIVKLKQTMMHLWKNKNHIMYLRVLYYTQYKQNMI